MRGYAWRVCQTADVRCGVIRIRHPLGSSLPVSPSNRTTREPVWSSQTGHKPPIKPTCKASDVAG
jgi:hypothetical protein